MGIADYPFAAPAETLDRLRILRAGAAKDSSGDPTLRQVGAWIKDSDNIPDRSKCLRGAPSIKLKSKN